jgi:hypothetical protein
LFGLFVLRRQRSMNDVSDQRQLEMIIKEKVGCASILDEKNLKMIIDIIESVITNPSSSKSAPSSLSSSLSSSSSSSSLMSTSTINIIDMYKHDPAFVRLVESLRKNDVDYFEECFSECTTFDEVNEKRVTLHMRSVRVKQRIAKKSVNFGMLSGEVISRSEYDHHKHLRYKLYADTLRALPVGYDRILLVDFHCLGGLINSASSSYKHTQYKNGMPPQSKCKMIQSLKWPGLYYFETMNDVTIAKEEEIFTLYFNDIDVETSITDDFNEANKVSLTQISDNEDDDPTVTLSQL